MKNMQFGRIYGRIAKIAAQLSYGLVNSAMGQIPCSTERISSLFLILPSYPNDSSALIDLSYADNYLLHVFHLNPFLCVMSSRRQEVRCLATK